MCAVNITIVHALVGGLLLGPGESESNTVVVCMHEACGRSPVWIPSSVWHVLVQSS